MRLPQFDGVLALSLELNPEECSRCSSRRRGSGRSAPPALANTNFDRPGGLDLLIGNAFG